MASLEQTLRFAQANELANVASRAHGNNELASAVMLYVPALEMIGWEINQQLGFIPFIEETFHWSKNHRIRHFAAASVMLGHALRHAPPGAASQVDFSKVSFEIIPKPGGGPKDVSIKPNVTNSVMISSLVDCIPRSPDRHSK